MKLRYVFATVVVVVGCEAESGKAPPSTPPPAAPSAPSGATGWVCYVEQSDGTCVRPEDRDICDETVADRKAAGHPAGTCVDQPKAMCLTYREKMKGNEPETWCYPTAVICEAYRQRYAGQPDNYSDIGACTER